MAVSTPTYPGQVMLKNSPAEPRRRATSTWRPRPVNGQSSVRASHGSRLRRARASCSPLIRRVEKPDAREAKACRNCLNFCEIRRARSHQPATRHRIEGRQEQSRRARKPSQNRYVPRALGLAFQSMPHGSAVTDVDNGICGRGASMRRDTGKRPPTPCPSPQALECGPIGLTLDITRELRTLRQQLEHHSPAQGQADHDIGRRERSPIRYGPRPDTAFATTSAMVSKSP